MKLKPLIYGVATLLPGVSKLRASRTGGTDSARYCYSVWLRHLVMAEKNGLNPYPRIVAELGPGDSLGIGLAALISGCEKYFAFDVVQHANVERNLAVFDGMVALFRQKEPIPGDDEFPKVLPRLEDYRFPINVLDDIRLTSALHSVRLQRIRSSLSNLSHGDSVVQYKVPWFEAKVLESNSVDLIYSQAVLEHVDDLRNTYSAMYSWLKPDGYMSHTIDYSCHGTADEWNGHWACSDFLWQLIRGNRPYLLNREPHSAHIKLMEAAGFRIVCDRTTASQSRLAPSQLAPKFRSISRDDIVTSGAFIQGVKKSEDNA